MKKMVLFAGLLLAFVGNISGQTSLAKGDLLITGIDTPGETFSFVILVPITSGTVVYFSDNNVTSAGGTALATTEGFVTFTASTGYPAGTAFRYPGATSGEFAMSGSFALGNSGDNLFAYQGVSTTSASVFLHLLRDTGVATNLPSGLESSDVVVIGNDDGEYTGSRVGTKSELISSINNVSNWTVTGAFAGTLSTNAFTVNSDTPATITYSSPSQISAGNAEQGTNNHILSAFQIAVVDADATLQSIAFPTTGNYEAADIKANGFKLWSDTDATFSGATQLGTSQAATSSGSGETVTFSSLAQTITSGTTRYYWLTVDVASTATAGRTLTAGALSTTDITLASGNESGSVTAGGTMTIIASATPSLEASVSSITSFGNVANGSSSTPDSVTVSGINLTVDLVVTTPSGFQVSTSKDSGFGSTVNLSPSSGTVSATKVYVRFSPSSAGGSASGNVVLSSTGATSVNVSVSGFAFASEPTTQASAVSFGTTTATSMVINWTRGSGDSVIVAMRAGSAVSDFPADRTAYTASSVFGSGSNLGNSTRVVFEGTGTTVTVTGLSGGTTYHVAVMEYNSGALSGVTNYNVTAATASNATVVSELLLEDNFDYTVGTLATANGWTNSSGTSNFQTIVESSLSYSGYASSGVGNKLSLTTTGEDVYKTFNGGSSGTVYSSALINVTAAQSGGDYMFHFRDNATTSGFFARTFIKSQESGFAIGLSTNNSTVTYLSTTYSFGITYLITIAYAINEGSGNDLVKLWVNPTLGGNEPSAANITLTTSTDATIPIVGIAIRQGTASTAPTFQIDGIRVATSWAQATNPNAITLTGSAGWRMMSSPVATSFSDLLDGTWTQGITGASASNGNASVYTHNGTTWVAPSNMSNTITAGSGFIVNVFEDDDANTTGTQGGFPKTLSVTGTENAAPVSFNLNGGSGVYTVAGNPFASAIDWDVVFAASTNVSATAYVYDPTYTATENDGATGQSVGGAYRAWNGSVGGLTDGLIAPFQGFWVQATDASASLSFAANAKTTGATFRGKETRIEKLRLIVSHKDGGSNDAWIQFSPNGKVGFDAWDGWKLQPFTSNYLLLNSGYANGYPLDINHLPVLSERMEIPFSMETTLNGSYSLRIENGLSSAATFEVLDTETGSRVRLSADNSYAFDVAKASKAVDAAPGRQPLQVKATTSPRFVLIVTPGEATSNENGGRITELSLEQNFPNPFNPATTIRFNLPSASTVKLSVYDATGRLVDVVTSGMKSAGAHTVSWNAAKQASGIYLLRLEANGQLLTRKMTLLK